MLLVTEVLKKPKVFAEKGTTKELLGLLFSDGKPIVAFAAGDKKIGNGMCAIRVGLRRRLWLATRLLHRQGKKWCGSSVHHRTDVSASEQIFIHPWGDYVWTYEGVMGLLVGGQVLTGVGSALFVGVDFSFPALVSLLASLFAVVVTTKRNMRAVSREITPTLSFHNVRGGTDNADSCNANHFVAGWEIVMPGPLALLRFLLAAPVWPIGLALFGFLDRTAVSSQPLWVWPPDWLSVREVDFGRPLDWILVQHVVLTWLAAVPSSPFLALWIIFAATFGVGLVFYLLGCFLALFGRFARAAFWYAVRFECCRHPKTNQGVLNAPRRNQLVFPDGIEAPKFTPTISPMHMATTTRETDDARTGLGRIFHETVFSKEEWASPGRWYQFRRGGASKFFLCTLSKYQGLFWQWLICQGSFGSMLSLCAVTRVSLALVISIEHTALLVAAIATDTCADLEWAFAFASLGWFLLMLVSEFFASSNPFTAEILPVS